MPKRNIFIFIIILIVIGLSIYGLSRIKKTNPPEQIFPEEEEALSLSQETIEYFNENIDSLSPEKPVLGGSWYITRFSLIDQDHIYLDYEDGHNMRRLLVEKKDNWKVLGFFEPGRDMWQLVEGKDPYLGSSVTIYELTDENEWILIN